jgi:hypothetical protein
MLLTVVLARRFLADRQRSDGFLSLDSRVRVRMAVEHASPQDLQVCLRYIMQAAGAPALMTEMLIATMLTATYAQP